jgi:hypothetical protein
VISGNMRIAITTVHTKARNDYATLETRRARPEFKRR